MSDPTDAPDETRCPRCGGLPAAARKPTPASPFLPKSRPRPTCADCGLDFDRDAKPWGPGDLRASSTEKD
jgi:hypothetical protein